MAFPTHEKGYRKQTGRKNKKKLKAFYVGIESAKQCLCPRKEFSISSEG